MQAMKIRFVAIRSRLTVGVIGVMLCAGEVTGLPGQRAEQASAIFAQGQTALTKGELTAAETDFREVLKVEPGSVPARANLGVVYMRRKQWTMALEQFQAAEHLAPGNPGLETDIGLAYFHQENFGAAIEPFQAVLRSDPSSFQARYLVGLCWFATEKYSAAVDALKPLWASENSKLTYLYILALAANKAGETELEKQSLERMYQVGSNSAEYHLFMGRAWLLRQRDADALRELREAARLNPKLPFVHYSMGVIYASGGDYLHAKNEFLMDTQNEPDFALNYQELGTACSRLGQQADAETFFNKAANLNPSLASTYIGLAKLYKADHRLGKALAVLDKANKLDGQSASLHYLRAQTLAQLNRKEEANTEFAISARLRRSTRDRLEEQVSSRSSLDAQMGLTQP